MPYTVFPLHALTLDGSCACYEGAACNRPGKHPAIKWGDLSPGAQVRGPAGHGIVTGWKSGVFVVDTDGPEAEAAYVAAHPEGLDTFTVATPSGGKHRYYAWPGFPVKNSIGELAPKVDVRGDGGFVVAPGSPHRSGRSYTVEKNAPVATAPAWLVAWPGLKGRATVEGEGTWRPFPVDLSTKLGQTRLGMGREACETLPASVQGESGSAALWHLSLRLVRDLELPLEAAAELVATVYNPRCDPPWAPHEIAHKLEDARDKSDRMPGDVTPIDLGRVVEHETKETSKRRKAKTPGHRYPVSLASVSAMTPGKTTCGKVLDILSNVPDWEGVLAYDEFRDRITAVDPPIKLEAERTCFAERDVTSVRKWFEVAAGLVVAKDVAWDAVIGVAHENKFHPVREYLSGLPAGNPDDLAHAARMFFGSSDALDATLVRKFMVGAVRRVLNPGEKLDTMLVLVGDQGAFKSSFVGALFGDEFTSEDLADLKSKDAMIGLAGKWAIEVAELDKILRQDCETVKAFISRRVDPYRAPYERVSTDHPRQCVYVGTTNKDDFLRDPTGERRYWIVDLRKTGCGTADLEAVAKWRDRLWASAYAVALLPKKDEPHWLTADEAATLRARASFYKGEDGWHDAITTYCTGRDFVTVDGVFKALGGSTDKLDRKQTNRITDILRELGCHKDVKGPERARVRGWRVSEDLRRAEVPPDEANRRAGADIVSDIMKGALL